MELTALRSTLVRYGQARPSISRGGHHQLSEAPMRKLEVEHDSHNCWETVGGHGNYWVLRRKDERQVLCRTELWSFARQAITNCASCPADIQHVAQFFH